MISSFKSSRGIIAASLLLCVFMLLILPSTAARKPHPASHMHRGLNKDSINCVVYISAGVTVTGTDASIPNRLSCSAQNHGPTVLLTGDHDTFFNTELLSGQTSLIIPTDLVSGNRVVDLNDPSSFERISVFVKGQRNLRGSVNTKRSLIANYDGSFKTLVVRISDTIGNSPTHSATELSQHIFSDELTMASQYRACSNDKLRFTPADGGSTNVIKNGVVDVTVDIDLRHSYDSSDCHTAADNVLSDLDIGDTHTYTMYICPDVVDFGVAAGVGDIGGTKTWYLDEHGSSPYVQMHELGHNLQFFHSGEGNLEYGDPTGIMGGRYNPATHWGKMCFNAAKTWQAGWYSDHHSTVTPTNESYIGNIVDVNSVALGGISANDDVVVKVKSADELSLYFMLHRLEGITSDMKEDYIDTHANKINIQRWGFLGSSSKAIGQLAAGEEYIQENWSNTGKALHIKVCSIAKSFTDGGAKVLVYLDGDNTVTCDGPITTVAPTMNPTSSQQAIATMNPTSSQEQSSPRQCQDSTLKIKVNSVKRTCGWVGKKPEQTQSRCQKPGVASHCQKTCGTCMLCSDSGKRFELKETLDYLSCSWVGRTSTKSRCKMEGVADTCRKTCGMCS